MTSPPRPAASEAPICDALYLIDTNVLSPSATTKAVSVVTMIDWMDRNSASLYLSVVTIAEIEDGIAKSRGEGAPRKADRLSELLEVVLHMYAAKIMPVDLAIARHTGRLSDPARTRARARLCISYDRRHDLASWLDGPDPECPALRTFGVPAHYLFASLPSTLK